MVILIGGSFRKAAQGRLQSTVAATSSLLRVK